MISAEEVKSIFDDDMHLPEEIQSSEFWKMDINQTDYTSKPLKTLCEGFLLRRRKKNTYIWTMGYFVLTPDNIHFYEDSSKTNLLGVGQIRFARVYCTVNKETPDPELTKETYAKGFRIVKNGYSFELYTTNEEEFALWRSSLSELCILTDFHSHYSATKLIGKGGFSNVYLVLDKQTKEEYAVKAIAKEQVMKQEKGRLALKNEIELHSGLRHPHILKLKEVFESENSVYLVFELLKGGNLNMKYGRYEVQNEENIREIMKQILNGLVYLHKRGIAHRDIKPDNILMKTDEKNDFSLKIADFGLSTHVFRQKALYQRCGTPGYIAPEVMRSKPTLSVAVDMFSAGIVLYKLLVGETPFHSSNMNQILENNRNGYIEYNMPHFLMVSVEAKDLMKKMLISDPTLRISAQDALSHPFFTDDKCNIPISPFSASRILQDNIAGVNLKQEFNMGKMKVERLDNLFTVCIQANTSRRKLDTLGGLPDSTQKINESSKSIVLVLRDHATLNGNINTIEKVNSKADDTDLADINTNLLKKKSLKPASNYCKRDLLSTKQTRDATLGPKTATNEEGGLILVGSGTSDPFKLFKIEKNFSPYGQQTQVIKASSAKDSVRRYEENIAQEDIADEHGLGVSVKQYNSTVLRGKKS